jgi:hypothetical protein
LTRVSTSQRDDIIALDTLIRKTVPALKPALWSNGTILGYGSFHYRYDSGREGDSPIIGLAARKAGFSLYLCALDTDGRYLAESHAAKLKPASVGKSCIRFKKLSVLDTRLLAKLLKTAVRSGGAFSV